MSFGDCADDNALRDGWQKFCRKRERFLAAEDIVILYQTISFRVRENGNTGSLPVAEMFRFRDGKVIEWRALYFDACMVARAINGT